jgi:hypothetical protein
MNNQYPAAGRVTGSATSGSAVGVLPPFSRESVAAARHRQSVEQIEIGEELSLGDRLQESLDCMTDDVLENEIVLLRRSINADIAKFTVEVRELERRNIPELTHGLRITGWLKRFCQMTGLEASGTLKTARAMVHMPTVTDNALAGEVPARSTQLLGQARDRFPSEFGDHERVFADVASYLSVADLRNAIDHWEQQVNYPKALDEVGRRDRRRSLYLASMLDGMGDIRGTLTPELFQLVDTVIDATVNPTFLDRDDPRTPAQRRADALGDVCRFYLDHNDITVTSGGEKPHVTVTVDYETLKGQAERLPELSGMPVTPETVRRITCDASIVPMVLGSDSEPLDVGRKTRTIPSAIRRALEQRDRGCVWDGCDAPASWCDAHHVIHWADGGDTSLGNLTLVCRKHHTATHNGRTPPPDT